MLSRLQEKNYRLKDKFIKIVYFSSTAYNIYSGFPLRMSIQSFVTFVQCLPIDWKKGMNL